MYLHLGFGVDCVPPGIYIPAMPGSQVDVDSETAYIDWWDTPLCPGPSIIVYNRENGHCHFLYALSVLVHTQPTARQGPLRFAAAVDMALTMVLGADPGYAGLICKNPLHEHWWTTVWEEDV
jgi:hypothetical protein